MIEPQGDGPASETTAAAVDAPPMSQTDLYAGAGYKMIEVEGAAFRVLLGTDPQQVAEWRAERRKRWPSRANLEQQAAAKRAKVDHKRISPAEYRRMWEEEIAREQDDGQPQLALLK